MKKSVCFLLFVLCLQIIISCKKEEIKVVYQKNQKDNRSIKYQINFPDTLYVGEKRNGIINYKSDLDTIITVFGDREKNRYVRFIFTTSNDVNYNQQYLKGIVTDTFGAINNREIPFYDIVFPEKGIYYIDGIINDVVVIDTIKDKSKNDFLRLIENEIRLTHKIVVIDKED